MPAPTADEIEKQLTAALLPDYPKVTMDGTTRVTDPSQLQPDMAKIVKGISAGLAATWTAWQLKQGVAVTTPVASAGVGPAALP